LARIAQSPHALVAIVGDSSVETLKSRYRLPTLYYVGDQGLQISGPGIEYTEPDAGLLQMALAILTQEVRSRVERIRGTRVEERSLTCRVDLRDVSPRRRGYARRTVAAAVFEVRQLFRCQETHGVCELRPNVEWSKPSAIRWILANAASPGDTMIYVGHDFSDEEAFRALPDAITVKIGSPQKTSARYYLESPRELGRFLSWLDATLSVR
jgi:trehalose-phosphatase